MACAQCLPQCPERDREAIALVRETEVGRLREGRVELLRDRTVACESCGRPVAPAAMLRRPAVLLGPDAPALDVIGRRCQDCRRLPAGV